MESLTSSKKEKNLAGNALLQGVVDGPAREVQDVEDGAVAVRLDLEEVLELGFPV